MPPVSGVKLCRRTRVKAFTQLLRIFFEICRGSSNIMHFVDSIVISRLPKWYKHVHKNEKLQPK